MLYECGPNLYEGPRINKTTPKGRATSPMVNNEIGENNMRIDGENLA